MRAFLVVSICSLLAGCASGAPKGEGRGPAQAEVEKPVIKYFSYKNKVTTEVIDSERWQGTRGGFSPGGRFDYLMKIYSASTRTKSRSGQRHTACFDGRADHVIQAFFDKNNPNHHIRSVQETVPRTQASTDQQMLGVAFTAELSKGQKREMFFRLPACSAGKMGMEPANGEAVEPGFNESAATQAPSVPESILKGANIPHQLYGFKMFDTVANPQQKKLPSFKLKTDFKDALPSDKDRPWRGLDVRSPQGAWELAVLSQKYAYENMVNQSKDPNFNLIAQNNKERYWCHMPWMNVGPKAREGVHGLTKERDLKPSPFMSLFRAASPGTDWGVAFYNSFGCKTIADIFGDAANPKPSPEFNRTNFTDGTFVAKFLFTSADFPAIKDAFTWDANVSGVGENNRSVRPVRHIQMDVAIRDSAIRGVKRELNDWIMITYYYDPNYDFDKEYKAATGKENPLKELKNLPEGFKKMRPMGIQTGFDVPETGDSMIFAGAETNGVGGRLNGPADNPESSCLSCHGVAGTAIKSVPGFLKNEEFLSQSAGHLDFSQQVSEARRNLETYIKTQAGEN